MALKKKKTPKFEEEQLYMLEILVDDLNLCPEKIINNKKYDLMIRVGFIDLAPVDIVAEDSIEVKSGKSKNKENRLFGENINYEGKTCLFVRTPSNLMQSVKLTPLSLEVYRILDGKKHNLRDDTNQILLCAATAFLPGCFHDRVAAAENKLDGLSKPYTLTEAYTLTDEEGSPCGSISMYLRLSCFGSSIINHLTLNEKSFILQGFPFGSKFHCTNSSDKNVNDAENETKCDDNVFSLLKILNPTCTKLRDQKYRTDKDSVLMRPESPPRVSIDQPGFEKLTSAEKLNDHKYRSLIYETYPDEPTCSCLPTDQSTHPMICRSGCARTCCMALRNPDILKDNSDNVPSLATLTHCVDNLHLKSATELNANATRMRGGVDREDDYLNSKIIWDDECTSCENNIDFHAKDRMKGGSNHGLSVNATSETTTTLLYQNGAKTSAGSPCNFRPRTADGLKAAGCICPGKDLSSWRTGTSNCTKKPCVGADCMIRAFKEAQEFVDSLNKVQGLAGLGLMDPSESPYFGRDIDKDYAVKETPSEKKRGYPVSTSPALPTVQCTAPCNTQFSKPVVSSALIPYAISTPTTIAVPGRTGVVREAIPTLPEATLVPIAVKPKKKEERKEEKSEKQKELDIATSVPPDVGVGPCGEPKCKSRRKTPENSRAVSRETNESQKNATIYVKPPSTHIVKSKSSEKRRHLKSKPGPGGDRDIRRGPIRISKEVMRYVYSIGEVYPGINYGHKTCLNPRFRIPANMGWLWNTSDMVGKLKPRIGWKPGAIARRVNELLKEAKGTVLDSPSVLDSRLRITPSRTGLRRGKVFKTMSYTTLAKKEGEEETEPPPTLHIHRKDGTYYVTMYPIRQEAADATHLEEPIKPLQFKIARNRDDASVASSSTASDMEIEFSPPAAVNRYRRKPDVIHVDTQVRQQEILDAFKSMDDVPKKKERKGKRGKK
nr:PREDICTED: LOW QUALITY PROTEIN: uncharacterized protein LOC105668656 [Linepithema humile]